MWISRLTTIIISILSLHFFHISATVNNHPRADGLPSDSVYIINQTHFGSACSTFSPSIQVTLSPNSDSITIDYSNFTLSTPPGLPGSGLPRDWLAVQTCSVVFTLHHPAGWAFAIPEATIFGELELRNITLWGGAGYAEQDINRGFAAKDWNSPYSGELVFEHEVNATAVCGDGSSTESMLMLDQVYGLRFPEEGAEPYGHAQIKTQELVLDWQKCS